MSGMLALACAPLVAVSAYVVFAIGRICRNTEALPFFHLAGVAVLLWQFSCVFELAVGGGPLFHYAHGLQVPFMAFASLGFLLLTLRFYGLGDYMTGRLMALILVLPVVTLLLALAGDPYGLLYTQVELVSLAPAYEVRYVYGPWQWAHILYCGLMLVLASYFAVTRHRQLPRSFRECSSLMVASLVVVGLTLLLTLFINRGVGLVLTVAGTCCALVPLYVAMTNNTRMNYLYMARTHILDQLETSVFILDKDNNLIDANQAAWNSLEDWMGSREVASMNQVWQRVEEMGAGFAPAVKGEEGTDVTIPGSGGAAGRVINVREETLTDKKGRLLGRAVVCADVTRNRRLIRWLEQTSGTDALTGLANRSSLGLRRPEYEAEEALPLSVIAGDVDGLKTVNDTHGHLYGDQLLVAVGQALAGSVPPQGTAYRIGGDEFVVVLPRTGPDEARQVQERIERAMQETQTPIGRPSMALGAATGTARNLSLEELMHLADQSMYRAKRRRKT